MGVLSPGHGWQAATSGTPHLGAAPGSTYLPTNVQLTGYQSGGGGWRLRRWRFAISGVPFVEPPSTRTGSKSLQVCRATLSRQARGVAATLLC